jgi:hypothetical protein
LLRIDNYRQCVLAQKDFPPRAGTFDLSNADYGEIAGADTCEPFQSTFQEARISLLVAGCWAYKKTEMIAASALLRVHPEETFNYGNAIPRSGPCETNFASCYEPDLGRFGSCAEHACRPPCVTDRDCEAGMAAWFGRTSSQPPDGGAPDAGVTCKWECRRERPDDHVGACFELL